MLRMERFVDEYWSSSKYGKELIHIGIRIGKAVMIYVK